MRDANNECKKEKIKRFWFYIKVLLHPLLNCFFTVLQDRNKNKYVMRFKFSGSTFRVFWLKSTYMFIQFVLVDKPIIRLKKGVKVAVPLNSPYLQRIQSMQCGLRLVKNVRNSKMLSFLNFFFNAQ